MSNLNHSDSIHLSKCFEKWKKFILAVKLFLGKVNNSIWFIINNECIQLKDAQLLKANSQYIGQIDQLSNLGFHMHLSAHLVCDFCSLQ